MPRVVVLSNGRIFVAYDAEGRARDVTWPHVGMPNHTVDRRIAWGVFSDGRAHWLGGSEWEVAARYEDSGGKVARWTLRNWTAGLEVEVLDAVAPGRDAWVRRMEVTDLRGVGRGIALLATHALALGQSDVGNTAYWDPGPGCVVHYRWGWAAAFRLAGGEGPAEFACGIAGFEGREGTWRDAEDGRLEGNPVAQGSVDSTLLLRLELPPQGKATADWECCFEASGEEAAAALAATQPEAVVREAREHGAAWAATVPPAACADVAAACALQDSAGAWIAAIDGDILETNRATYAYCWPRDAALAAHLMVDIGRRDEALRFLGFCVRCLRPDGPPLLQKYTAEGRLGASWHPWVADGGREVPWQQDESALVALACAAWLRRFGDDGSVRLLLDRCASYLAGSVGEDGLPGPSWDMWEERRGVHAATVCLTVAALSDGAAILGEAAWQAAAGRMRDAFEARFYDPGLGRYARSIGQAGPDATPDAALVFGLLRMPDAAHAAATAASVGEALAVRTEVGGVARYDGDYYFRQTAEVPGNPWVICTAWCHAWRAREDPGAAAEFLAWAGGRRGPAGLLAEQYHPYSGAPLSVAPLAWSHVETARLALVAEKGSGPAG